MEAMGLRTVDKVEVVVLVDNYSDFFLPDSEVVKRLRVLPPGAPLAEPGLAYLVKVYVGEETHTLLFDTGISGTCLLHNARTFASSMAVLTGAVGADLNEVEAVVLSHGHFDHCGGLLSFFDQAAIKMPVFMHSGAFVPRRFQVAPELLIDMPTMNETALAQAGADLRQVEGAALIAADTVLLSGRVPRQTSFEQGMPGMEARIDDEWVVDPFHDDQALAFNLKGKGLVIVGGCSHAGIINTVKHLQNASAVQAVHAVMGGFHLAGANEDRIDPTIEAIKVFDADYVVPMHCTGWKAINQFAREMPDRFILNSVGTTYVLT